MEKFVIFRLGTEEFGVSIKRVVEILKAQTPSPLPDMPDYVTGVITLRGVVIPLMDMRRRFNLTPRPVNERVIIVRSRGERIGIIVDEVSEILPLQAGEVSRSPKFFKGLKTEYLTGIGRRDARVIILLNIDMVLSSEETIVLKSAVETAG